MSDHSAHDIAKSIRKYWFVFFALIVGTAITVGAYFIELPSLPLTIAVALFIATVKAFLVAGYFMHLIDERKMIYGIMGSTVFFFIALMVLTIWAMNDLPPHTMHR
jgi:cytochrome c oxidase subunit 4